ncbi:hypothetical protein [Pseudomonas viridiflava]|uniref:Uncharacterized protein n=1 Tax=Pseudomonas viridiflava TaxID=33069 RepID=A0AA46W3Y3_PSEVI|nr:hypothetical protein [Pseudomonas viridiflava]UZA71494.1 hypothetical protein EZZ81_25945 [Pseudomonas viridiflava]
MTDKAKPFASNKEWLQNRQQAAGNNRLVQAHAMAIMWLETQDLSPETVEQALRVANRYLAGLADCVEALGGSDLKVTATFPEGEMTIDVLSQVNALSQ